MGGFMERVVALVRSVASFAKKAITAYVSWSRRKWGEGRAGKAQASVASLAIVFLLTRLFGGGDVNEIDPKSTISPLAAPARIEVATTEPADEPETTERPTREPSPTREPTNTAEPATDIPVPPTETPFPPTAVPATAVPAPPTEPPAPPPSPPPAQPAGLACAGARRCDEFGTHAAAQEYFERCGRPARMDSDKDGIACESLP